ncbi:TPA: UDP-N-acetylmuramyl-tripeptide synthetase [Candidatus Peregrinibacteria bacterium]|nr:UDP-N-acetylmuramyl-tripeptide synthetase [Candidatus Peregrinibacteria bacterium]HIQ57513.1 UDP-N-acetylmuramyl-tripeptide synthetase [Candidatus Gracilibacteria bacterium]
MLKKIKSLVKNIISEKLLLKYHGINNFFASIVYGNPSKKMKVIGITGTKGKSTAANFIWAVLQKNEIKTGVIGTANIRIGNNEFLNTSHMTMPGAMEMQKLLAKMQKSGCEVVVMEVTSEGIKQHRNDNIYYSIGIFTNLSPEHLQSHNNSFKEYKNTKKKFFTQLKEQNAELIIVNNDNEFSHEFLEEDIQKKVTVSMKYAENLDKNISDNIFAVISNITPNKTFFSVNKTEKYALKIGGDKNVENALLAVAVGKHFKLSAEQIQFGFDSLSVIPGRMERIQVGQNFSVFVDYAHEKLSMEFILKTARECVKGTDGKVIILLGAEGGGRDTAKREVMGRQVGKSSKDNGADFVIVSNVDPYEDDPTEIAEGIAIFAEKEGKVRNKNLFVIEDRRAGIAKALQIGKENSNNIVFITGKGSEQSIVISGVSLLWDDRRVVREELQKIL